MHPVIVVAAVIRRQGKVLITLRPEGSRHAGSWEFPGGKLDGGESPEEGLRREIREELDLEIEVGGIFDVVYHRYPWGPVLILAYTCLPSAGSIRHLGVADHRWVDPEELVHFPLLAADRPLVERLRTELSGPAEESRAGKVR